MRTGKFAVGEIFELKSEKMRGKRRREIARGASEKGGKSKSLHKVTRLKWRDVQLLG